MGFDDIFTSNHEGEKCIHAENEKRLPSPQRDKSQMCSWSCLGDAEAFVADPKVSGGSFNLTTRSDSNVKGSQSFVEALKGVEEPFSIADLPSPSIRGQFPSIKIPKAMYNKGVDKLKFSLIGKLDLQKIKRDRLVELLKQIWKVNTQIIPLGKGFILFRFDRESDLQSVWKGGPYEFDKQVLWLQLWTPSFDPQYQRQSHALVWVRFPGLKIHLWENDILLSLAKAVGAPISVDRFTLEKRYGHFASVLVEVDMAQPLPTNVRIEIEGVEEFVQDIEYWKLPKFCSSCKTVGHLPVECRKRKTGVDHTTQPRANEVWKQVAKPKVVVDPAEAGKDFTDAGFGEPGVSVGVHPIGASVEAAASIAAEVAVVKAGFGVGGGSFVDALAAGYGVSDGVLGANAGDEVAASMVAEVAVVKAGFGVAVDALEAGCGVSPSGGDVNANVNTYNGKSNEGEAFSKSPAEKRRLAGPAHDSNILYDIGVGSKESMHAAPFLNARVEDCVTTWDVGHANSTSGQNTSASANIQNVVLQNVTQSDGHFVFPNNGLGVPVDTADGATDNSSGPKDHENSHLRNSNTSLVTSGVRQSTAVDIRHANQLSAVSSAAAGGSAGSGRSWKVNSKLFRNKKKSTNTKLDKELREIILSNRWEDLAEMEDPDDYLDYSDDQVEPIVETSKKPTSSNVITRQQARQQHLGLLTPY